MKILVTGATGFIGRQLLLLLREKGHDIVVLTRDPDTASIRLPVACSVFGWDPDLLEPPKEAFRGVEAVVHLAGESLLGQWSPERKEEIIRSRTLSTHHLVRAMKNQDEKPEVFICASGVGVYGDRGEEALDEGASVGHGFLANLCHKWEAEALQARTGGIRTVLMRAGVVLGNEGGALRWMLPAFRLGLGGKAGTGRQWMSWIHVRDLARMILHAVETQSLEGPVNAVSPQPETNADFSAALARALRRPAFLFAPVLFLEKLLGDMSQVILFSQKVSAAKIQETGFHFEYPDLKSAFEGIAEVYTHELLLEQWVPRPVEEVFSFFSDARNLEILTPPFLKFKVTSQNTQPVFEGMHINYRLKLHGIPFRWQSMIMDWKPNERFSDIQVVGPYWLWHHTHDFIPRDGGTLVRDRAVYRIPFWTLGDILLQPMIRKELEAIFSYRQKKVLELFGE